LTISATDTVVINSGDSRIALTKLDSVIDFRLGNGVSTTGVDNIKLRLDVTSNTSYKAIAANVSADNGVNVGVIKSHSISNGVISFDDLDSYTSPFIVDAVNLNSVVKYLQLNVADEESVAFTAMTHTYLFHNGEIDTLVELTGITATNLNTTGLVDGGVWLA